MPQYYTGSNPATALSDGLMAGYNFVDSIRARRRQLDLQERQMGLAENADARAESAEGRASSEYTHLSDRRVVTEGREDRDDKFTVSERNRALDRRAEDDAARDTLAGAILEGGAPQSLQSIGASGGQRQSPAGVPQTEQPPNVPQTAQPSGPVDLRAAQKTADDAPNFLEKIFSGPVEKSASKLWDSVADPSDDSAAILQGRGKAVSTSDIRRNPAQYADKYISEREKVSPKARAALDTTMTNALNEQLATLDPKDQRNAPKIQSINTKLGTLAKATTSSAAVDAGITRPVKVDDARVVPAITAAAAKARDAQPILETTPDELRAAGTMVARLGGTKRLNQKQISALTTLYAHGGVTAEELNNWSKYGTPIAPTKPTVTALGGGMGVMITDTGVSLIGLPTGAGAKGAAGSASNQRLLVNDRLKQLSVGFKGMVEAGELSDGSPSQHLTNFLQILKREAPGLQMKSGIPVLGADGALNLGESDPGEIAELMSMYQQYDAGEVKPWFFKGGKSMTDYAPESAGGDEIIDLTSAFE